ncbi:hypothetical protein KC717_00045 [Candidatus Dojkabacteria bacterium]|uniref:Uncharacterized protein n=1 Tax=Candidatus Dojkabacteria bacterium TaxID=2099670 RepID=A0A955RJR6_9BACT|nr:hypothetical protein [Candidatus Dojkabacteria bacterium]
MPRGVRMLIITVAFILIGFLGISLYMRYTDESDVADNSSDSVEDFYLVQVGDNETILENGDNSLSEGTKIPRDIDVSILPELPITSELLNVTDSKQTNIRIILLDYNVIRDAAAVREMVVSDLTKKDWDSITQLDDGRIEAVKGDYELTVTVNQLAALKSLVNMVITIRSD